MLEGEIDKNMHGMEMIFNLSSAAVLIMSSFNRVLLLSLSFLHHHLLLFPISFLSRVNVKKCLKMKNSCINFVINLS